MQSVGKSDNLKTPFIQLKNIFTDTISSLFTSYSKMESLEIVVPKNIYLRTQLICAYIQDFTGQTFDENMFLTLLYDDFLRNSIERYNPNTIRHEIDRYRHDEKLLIHSNDRIYAYGKSKGKHIVFTIAFYKSQIEKGELLLDELEEIYGESPTLEQMIATIWVNFIEDYKTTGSKVALQRIEALLIKSIEEET